MVEGEIRHDAERSRDAKEGKEREDVDRKSGGDDEYRQLETGPSSAFHTRQAILSIGVEVEQNFEDPVRKGAVQIVKDIGPRGMPLAYRRRHPTE